MLRITGGTQKGRRIACPRGKRVRPTLARVRRAVLDILGSSFDGGVVVLDLFAGSGALGLEALSRGAGHCVFVEKDRHVVTVLRRNIGRLGFESRAMVCATTAESALQRFVRSGRRFDVVFVDPPYDSPLAAKTLTALSDGKVLRPNAVIVLQTDPRGDFRRSCGGITKVVERVYGDTAIHVYAHPPEDSDNVVESQPATPA